MFGQNNFGSPTSAFGGGAFSAGPATNTSTSIFGQTTAPAGNQTSLFGSTFGGSPRPTTFGSSFGAGPTTSTVFGQQTRLPAPTGSMFSTQTTVASPFSATSAQSQGTPVAFNPITGSDTMMRNGVASPISTRHICITCMKDYENFSMEELRLADYQLNRKFGNQGQAQPQQTGGGLFSASPSGSNAFGQRSTPFGAAAPQPGTGLFSNLGAPKVGFFSNNTTGAATSAFGGTSNFNFSNPTTQATAGSMFGQGAGATTSSVGGGLGSSTPFAFGQPTQQQQQQSSLFGQKPIAPATSTTGFSGFGAGSVGTAPALQKPLSLFGSGTSTFASTSTPTFGTGAGTSAAGSLFGTQTQGVKPFSFNTSFGQPTTSQPGGLGGFGSTSAPTASSAPFSFSAPSSAPAPSINFGSSIPSFASGVAGGGSPFGTQSSASTSFAPFGSSTTFSFANPSTNTTSSTGFGLGQPPGGGSTAPSLNFNLPSFNSSAGLNQSLGYGSGGGGIGSLGQPSAVPGTGPVPFATTPYKDSALFYNLITNRDINEMTKPTSPTAQRAIREAARRRNSSASGFSSLSGGTMKPKDSSSSYSGSRTSSLTASIFEGFQEDDYKGNIDILAPKCSVKKLDMSVVRSRLSLPPAGLNKSGVNSSTNGGGGTGTPGRSVKSPESGKQILSFRNHTSTLAGGKNVHNSVSFEDDDDKDERTEGPGPSGGVSRSVVPVVDLARPDENKHEGQPRTEPVTSNKNGQNGELVPVVPVKTIPRCGVICTRIGYYTKPDVSELDMMTSDDEHCKVSKFIIGRKNYGMIRFLNTVEIFGLNIDEIVSFRHKEVVVYPDDEGKPPQGEGINVPAEISLVRVWPIDKETREPIRSPTRVKELNYADRLRRACKRMQAEFISYEEEGGVWIFRVNHFSKYSCVPEDEEDSIEEIQSDKGLGGLTISQLKARARSGAPALPPPEGALVETPRPGPAVRFQIPTQSNSGRSPPKPPQSANMSLLKASLLPPLPEIPSNFLNSLLNNNNEDSAPLPRISLDWLGPVYPPHPVDHPPWLPPYNRTSKYGYGFGAFRQPPGRVPPRVRRKEEGKRLPFLHPVNLFGVLNRISDTTVVPRRGVRVSFGRGGLLIRVENQRPKNTNSTLRFHGRVILEVPDFEERSPFEQHVIQSQLALTLKGTTRFLDTFNSPCDVLDNLEYLETLIETAPLQERIGLRSHIALWNLIHILWPTWTEDNPDPDPTAAFIKLNTRQKVGIWLKRYCDVLMDVNIPSTNSPGGLLARGLKNEACEMAVDEDQPLLALCLAQNNPVTQRKCGKQFYHWEKDGALYFFPPEVISLWEITAGLPIWDPEQLLNFTTPEWLRHFALFTWFLNPSHRTMTQTVKDYMNEIGTGVREVGEDPTTFSYPSAEGTTPTISNLIINILKLYSTTGYPMGKLLCPTTHNPSPLKYALSWSLMCVLQRCASQVEQELMESITVGFAGELERSGLYPWAIFILKHLNESGERDLTIQRILEKNLGIGGGDGRTRDEDEKLLIEKLGVSKFEIQLGKALRIVTEHRMGPKEILEASERMKSEKDGMLPKAATVKMDQIMTMAMEEAEINRDGSTRERCPNLPICSRRVRERKDEFQYI